MCRAVFIRQISADNIDADIGRIFLINTQRFTVFADDLARTADLERDLIAVVGLDIDTVAGVIKSADRHSFRRDGFTRTANGAGNDIGRAALEHKTRVAGDGAAARNGQCTVLLRLVNTRVFALYRAVDHLNIGSALAAAAVAVARGNCDKGIVLCTTGIGVSIVANKVDGIRCALLSDLKSAEMTRLHNDTNMMAMGAGIVSEELAMQIVDKWLDTPFSGEPRHQRRIDKVMALEK